MKTACPKHLVHGPDTPTEHAVAAGIDGCRAGWVAAIAVGDGRRPQRTVLRLFRHAREIVRWRDDQPDEVVVAIDVPIGLPPAVSLRECDRQARARLGRRWMSVFEPPDRDLFGHDFEGAREIVFARRARTPRATFHVLTQQGTHIVGKIAEIDRIMIEDPSRQSWLIEVHPEVSFRELAQEDLPRKRSAAGKARRRELVRGHFADVEERLGAAPWRRRDVGYDDVLDAYAALWSALRFARGPKHHIELGRGERDEHGLPMRMVV